MCALPIHAAHGLHTGHTPSGKYEVQPEGQYPIPDTLRTLGKIFQQAGYHTAAFGKWGLGFVGTTGDPSNQGFDQFFGYNCQRYAHRYYPAYLWENQHQVPLPGNDWSLKPPLHQTSSMKKVCNSSKKIKMSLSFFFFPWYCHMLNLPFLRTRPITITVKNLSKRNHILRQEAEIMALK